MVEFETGRVPNTSGREYTAEDYQRVENWVEERIDPSQVDGLRSGRRHVKNISSANGVRKLLRRGQFDELLFESFAEDTVSSVEPSRPVESKVKWEERKEKLVNRARRTGRLMKELERFQFPTQRSLTEESLGEEFDRSPVTIRKDIRSLRSAGWIRRLNPDLYALTDEGREVLKNWREENA